MIRVDGKRLYHLVNAAGPINLHVNLAPVSLLSQTKEQALVVRRKIARSPGQPPNRFSILEKKRYLSADWVPRTLPSGQPDADPGVC